MTSDTKHLATCACGSLRVTADGEPDFVVVCHCLACQRRTGSPFGTGVYYPRDRVTSIDGDVGTFTRTADSGRSLTNHFCPNCGTELKDDSIKERFREALLAPTIYKEENVEQALDEFKSRIQEISKENRFAL